MSVSTVAPRQAVVVLEPQDREALERMKAELLAVPVPDDVASPVAYQHCLQEEQRIRDFVERTKPAFDAVVSSAKQTYDLALGLRKAFVGSLETIAATRKRLTEAYVEREARLRRQEEQRVAEENRQRQVDQKKAEAKLLDKQGQKEMAAAVRSEPVYAPAVSLPSAVPVVEGVSYREDWYWEPIGGDTPENRARALGLLVRPEVLQFVKFNDAGLTSFAKNTKGTVKVPGIAFRMKKTQVRR